MGFTPAGKHLVAGDWVEGEGFLGGRQQRVAIAPALAKSREYMLFDGVMSALDPMFVGDVLDTLKMLAKRA